MMAIIFFSLAGSVGDYKGAHTVIFREVFFFILLSRRKSKRICDGQVEGGGRIVFFRVPNSLQGCDGWGEGQGILFIKASLVHWKDKGYASDSLRLGLKKNILFLEILRGFLCVFRRKDQRSCDGWAE